LIANDRPGSGADRSPWQRFFAEPAAVRFCLSRRRFATGATRPGPGINPSEYADRVAAEK
jgi:hypothetical protein